MTAMFFVALSSLSPPGTWCLHYYSVAEGVPHVDVAVEEGAQATVIGRSLEAATGDCCRRKRLLRELKGESEEAVSENPKARSRERY